MEHIKVGKNEKILCDIEKAVYITHLRQQCHNSNICDFTGETFGGFEVP